MSLQHGISHYFKPVANMLHEEPPAHEPPLPPPPTAPIAAWVDTARKLVKAFKRAGLAYRFVDFQRVAQALPPPKVKLWSEVFTHDVLKELWPLFSSSLQHALGAYRWRTCTTLQRFEQICASIGQRAFGELGEHVSHVLLRYLHQGVPDDAKSSRVKGHERHGFDLDWQVDAGSLLEDLEIDGEGEVKSMRVHECIGAPDAAFRVSSDFVHQGKSFRRKTRDGRFVERQGAPYYNCLCVTQQINRGLLQRTDSSFLVNLIVCTNSDVKNGLTLRLSDKMSAAQRLRRHYNKPFVIAPDGKYSHDQHVVSRSLGMRGLEAKLDGHSRLLIRII